MELTVDQMLQQGLAAHKAGNSQEAERLYRAILQVHPKHPDANHNLGLIAVSIGQSGVALPLFKRAIGVNPNIEQFWLSYIEALISERQFEKAKRALKKGKKKGVAKEKLKVLEQGLVSVKAGNIPIQVPPRARLDSLLEHYQNGRYGDAEKLALSLTKQFPKHQFSWKMLGALLGQRGMNAEALNANQKAVQIEPLDAEAHNNLGAALKNMGRLEEAEVCSRQAIALDTDFAEAHINLGITLQAMGRLEDAEVSYKQAIGLKSVNPEAHNNLGITLQELGRLEEAEASCKQAIAMKPNYAEAHNNLGNVLRELGRLEDSKACLMQAIRLKSDFVEAHTNLGNALRELGRLEEAEESYRRAITLKFDYALSHFNLGKALYIKGCKELASESIEKAIDIDPKPKEFRILSFVTKSRKSREESEFTVSDRSDIAVLKGLSSNPLVLNRVVEAELIANLYEMSSIELFKTKDARFGRGTCSPDFNLFEDDRPIIKALAKSLTKTMMDAVKSEILIDDSFFNILSAGGGTTPHAHLNSLDKEKGLNLHKQKYSLVYYLSVGDQNCSDPGILKLYDPVEEILPREGMIVIIPAHRMHSAVYSGETDRVMIGVNFYSL